MIWGVCASNRKSAKSWAVLKSAPKPYTKEENENMDVHSLEVAQGKRFEFGKNWKRFLKYLNEERITKAEESLKTMLSVKNLEGKSFLDIG